MCTCIVIGDDYSILVCILYLPYLCTCDSVCAFLRANGPLDGCVARRGSGCGLDQEA